VLGRSLTARLRAFRARYGLTQAEVAAVLGVHDRSAVAHWERGTGLPDDAVQGRLLALLDGRRWPAVRAVMLGAAGEALPAVWGRAARWYRRASRERRQRATSGRLVAATLVRLRTAATAEALRDAYLGDDGDAMYRAAAAIGLPGGYGATLRRAADAAYGLRWLELAHGIHVDLDRALVPKLTPLQIA
jgi:transcriptional regulator with XRE-family HTH domain